MENIAAFVDTVRHRVDARLELVLADLAEQSRARAREAAPVAAQVRELTTRGGKRLRPAMLVAALESVAPWSEWAAPAIDVSAAIELLQTYLLIHDDWMDQDAVRRGGPTVHVALATLYGNEHRGAAAAVLAGDLASALAQDLIAGAVLPAPRHAGVMQAYAMMQREVVLGQVLDLLDSPDADAVHDLKTGSYTVRGPLALGHAIGGGSADAWAALAAFAQPLGIAFQLRDDLIGTFGDEKETGKPAGGDLRAGKRTAPIAFALERLDAAGRSELEGLLGSAAPGALARARALVESVGAHTAVEGKIAALRDRALSALEVPALRPDGRRLLAQLAHVITDRRK